MSRYTHFTKLKHLIFLNGGSKREVNVLKPPGSSPRRLRRPPQPPPNKPPPSQPVSPPPPEDAVRRRTVAAGRALASRLFRNPCNPRSGVSSGSWRHGVAPAILPHGARSRCSRSTCFGLLHLNGRLVPVACLIGADQGHLHLRHNAVRMVISAHLGYLATDEDAVEDAAAIAQPGRLCTRCSDLAVTR
jgi:hypothetical protein